MASAGNTGVMVVKRRKAAGGDAHHGGAWKVAYADFVTAMMAFFLLMWLLNATTEDQRKGLAEYFDPKVPIARISGGGSGVFAGDSVFSEDTLAQNGTGASDRRPSEQNRARGSDGGELEPVAAGSAELERKARYAAEESAAGPGAEARKDAQAEARQRIDDAASSEELATRHMRTRVTEEGFVIELFDVEGEPLFPKGSATPSPTMRALLRMVGEAVAPLVNRIAVDGFTDASPFAGTGYGNWELSSDRAHAARRALVAAGVAEPRMARVTGKADRELAFPDAPADPRNRRITVTVLHEAPAEEPAMPAGAGAAEEP